MNNSRNIVYFIRLCGVNSVLFVCPFVFKMEYKLPDWPSRRPIWNDDSLKLLINQAIQEPPNLKLKDIIDRSESFPINFPVDTIRCKSLEKIVDASILERNINSVYPLLHEKVLHLCADFILHKRKYGTVVEKEFYKNMNVLQLVERLLSKRAVSFLGKLDRYWLLDDTQGIGQWHIIGTKKQTAALNLKTCISYDEIKLAALLSVSSYTHYINDGIRHNCAKQADDRNQIESEGIIIGLVGTRLVKPNAMEFEEIVVAKAQNSKKNGFGNVKPPTTQTLFANFYEKPSYIYEDVAKRNDHNLVSMRSELYFDTGTYAQRLALSIDTLLIEANARAEKAGKSAFVHVVGIGLGVWRAFSMQIQLFLDICAKRIECLGENLQHVSDVFCDYFPPHLKCGDYESGDTIKPHGIRIHVGKRNPHEKLTGEHEGKLLVVSYAWDGNALPGNEFWLGSLESSSDPAAACSTQVAELHNPHINPKVNASNLRIATPNGVLSLKDYIKYVLSNKNI